MCRVIALSVVFEGSGKLPCNSQAAGEAALAADLITASKSLHGSTVASPSNFFLDLQYRKVSFLANGESLYPHL